jgi:hypothetical protein
MATNRRTVNALIGVYDADGGLRGELRYAAGHLLGRLHCGLCDITNSPLRKKASWDAMAASLGVPFALLHRNEQPEDVAAATGTLLPSVIAKLVTGELVRVFTPSELDNMGGEVDTFRSRLAERLEELSLALPASGQNAP